MQCHAVNETRWRVNSAKHFLCYHKSVRKYNFMDSKFSNEVLIVWKLYTLTSFFFSISANVVLHEGWKKSVICVSQIWFKIWLFYEISVHDFLSRETTICSLPGITLLKQLHNTAECGNDELLWSLLMKMVWL